MISSLYQVQRTKDGWWLGGYGNWTPTQDSAKTYLSEHEAESAGERAVPTERGARTSTQKCHKVIKFAPSPY